MNTGSSFRLPIRLTLCRLACLLIVYTSQQQALAQEAPIPFILTRYTTENGLPQNSIKGLAFDQLGYCWIGTENGLVKYDGIRFRLYDNFDIPPTSSRVSYIMQNKQKQILISFEGQEFYTIRNFPGFGTRPVRVKGDYNVSDFPGFQPIRGESDRSFFAPLISKQAPASSYILNDHQYYLVKADSLWIAHKNRPATCIIDKRLGKYPTTVIGDQLILMLNNHKAILYSNPNGRARLLMAKGLFFDQIATAGSPYTLMCSASGTYSFCQGKLYRLTLQDKTIYARLIAEGLADFTPNKLYYDEAFNTYYLQSHIDGLLLIRPNRFQSIHIPNGSWHQNSFYGQNTYGKDQIIANGALFTFSKGTKFPRIQRLISFPYSSASAYVQQDSYYYEKDFSLYKLNLVSRKTSQVAHLDEYIHCFNWSTYDSTLYFSTSDKLYALIQDKPVSALVLPPRKNQYIYGFRFWNADSVLIASNLGLLGASLRTGKTKFLLPNSNVRTIYIDKERYVWAGTYNSGVYLLQSGMVKALPIDVNKRLSVINSILEDHQGRIWFSTNNGLLSTARRSILNFFEGTGDIEPYTIYTKSDGLITNEFNGGAYPDKAYLSDGRVSLPTLKGLAVFNPDSFPDDHSPKPIFIDQVRVDGKLIKDLTHIRLAPDYQALTVSVSTPWKKKGESLIFERLVIGHDRQWISFSYGESISIRDYGHGDYSMRIRIKGYPQSQIEFPFSIAPYFYQTIWFKLALALAILLAVFVTFSYTITYYQRKTITLDQKIKERTQELNESLDHLHLTVERLQVVEARLQASLLQKDRIINMLLHDMKSPLFALKKGIEELDDRLSGQLGLSDVIASKSQLLRAGINDVYSFSINFFEWIKYQQEGFSANYQLTSLSDVFGRINELYGSIARSKGLTLVIPATEVVFYTDENILITILRNLVDNAIKHTQSGTIQLSVEATEKDYLVITVADTGPGMDELILANIQAAFNEELVLSDHAGYGYKLILHLVNLIHGDLELGNTGGLQVGIMLNFSFGQDG
ncbi:hypothetical protein GO755_36905 [Spirosoma sp. HMF4905]|uniref:Histidine kinase domain-containing protein n=1 Tax=Spirosoma arboris TaxID=2682092 RepID=A0A7K1SPB3_9BACT|nr:HAMP domain-containing sensor histidine kinase [Spirosoma arboris]MVM35654.1 hypothetical protein [Spirosoma arboris]